MVTGVSNEAILEELSAFIKLKNFSCYCFASLSANLEYASMQSIETHRISDMIILYSLKVNIGIKQILTSNENAPLLDAHSCGLSKAVQNCVIYNYYLGQIHHFCTKNSIPVTPLTHDVTSAFKIR